MARGGQFFRNEASLRSEVVLLNLDLVAVLLKSKYEVNRRVNRREGSHH